MTQYQRTNHFFPAFLIFLGIHHDRQRRGNTLITATRIAHDRNHGSGHACIARSRRVRKNTGKNAVSHYTSFIVIAQRLTQRVPVIAFERSFGSRLVQSCRIEYKINFFERCGKSKIIDLTQRQRAVFFRFLCDSRNTLIEQYVSVSCLINKTSMPTRNNGCRFIGTGRHNHLDIKFLGNIFFQLYIDTILGYHLFPALYIIGGYIFQYFELIIGISRQSTQSNGNGQPDHSRPRNTYAHSVFQDIRAQQYFYLFGFFSQQTGGFRHTQGNRNRLGTTDGGNNLPLYQPYNEISFCFFHISDRFLYAKIRRMTISKKFCDKRFGT